MFTLIFVTIIAIEYSTSRADVSLQPKICASRFWDLRRDGSMLLCRKILANEAFCGCRSQDMLPCTT